MITNKKGIALISLILILIGTVIIITGATATILFRKEETKNERVSSDEEFKFVLKFSDQNDLSYKLTLPEKNGEVNFKYDFEVYWGDGEKSTVKSFNDKNAEHKYKNTGEYTVAIKGIAEGGIKFFNGVTEYDGNGRVKTLLPTKEEIRNSAKLIKILTPYPKDMKIIQTNFEKYFYLTKITEVPEGLFAEYVNIESFSECFESCNELKHIPENLFKYNTEVTNFSYSFSSCKRITEVPENLFKFNVNAINFSGTFSFCERLEKIPDTIFKYNTKAEDFSFVFGYCESIRNIPQNIFKYATNAKTFSSIFMECKSLESIPENLFKYNVEAYSFSSAFEKCIKLTSLPNGLFKSISNVTSRGFNDCFMGCRNLSNEAINLWEMFPTFTKTDCYKGCEKLSNYNQIPDNWK